jgi:hypothetical protein
MLSWRDEWLLCEHQARQLANAAKVRIPPLAPEYSHCGNWEYARRVPINIDWD